MFEHLEQNKKIYSIYLSNEIEDPSKYTDMFHKLRTIEPEAGVLLYLAGVGGDCDGMLAIINAIHDCSAPVCSVVHGNVRSAHSSIAVAADQLIVYPDVVMMFHTYSGGMSGKSHELTSRLASDILQQKDIDKKYAIPFLTQAEFNQMLDGKDFWFHANRNDVKSRIARHNKHRKGKKK